MAPTRRELQLASPCAATWDGPVDGPDRVRRCQRCQLNVYRVSDLTREEAEEVVSQGEGRSCRRLYRRQDGTVLARDCPVGAAKARKAARWWKERVAHLLLLALPIFIIDAFIFIDPDNQQAEYDSSGSIFGEMFDVLDDLFAPPPAPPTGGSKTIYISSNPPPIAFDRDVFDRIDRPDDSVPPPD